MATELVLLSEIAASLETQRRALVKVCGDGTILEWRGGELTSLLDPEGANLLTVHAPKVIQLPEEAAAALGYPAPSAFGLWTEMTVPFGASDASRRVAEEIAVLVGGQVRERV